MSKIALFPGSFDPFTNGHLDLVERAAKLFDQVIVAVMTNTSKHALFTTPEKVALISAATAALPNVTVEAAPRLLTVAYAHRLGATVLVRGVRDEKDLDYETQIADMNRHLAGDIDTVLLPAKPQYRFLASSLIKEVATFGGDVSDLLPANVFAALQQKLGDAHGQTKD